MAVYSARVADTSFDALEFPVRATAAGAFILSALVLLGWQFDVGLLKSGLPGQSATQPLTAVCLCLCALALGLSSASSERYRIVTRLCALLPLALVLATLWQNALDTDWGLDRWLFADAVVHEQTGQFLRPGRTAGATLLAIAMLAVCLLIAEVRSRAANRLYVALATAGAVFCVAVLIAYAFSLKILYAMGLYANVSLNSGVILGALFIGALLHRSDLGWVRLLTSSAAGSESARRLLIWSVVLLFVLAAVVQICTANILYGEQIEATVVTFAALGLLLAGIVSHAERLNALDSARHTANARLRVVEEELASNTRAKDAFLAVLAHELRNPLSSLRNGIEIVRRRSGPDRMLSQTATTMARQMSQLVRLVDDLLDLSRVEQGTIELQRERVEVKEVVDRAVEACHDALRARQHALVVAPFDQSLAVHGDRHRLIQVVSNVLANSVHYTEPGGRISINVSHEGKQITVAIADSGSGILPEALDHAFDVFAELRAKRARTDGGLGVGLALVRSLIQLHGGSVSVRNPGPGAGSSVLIQLPALEEKKTLRVIPAPHAPNPQRQLRILVADDNTDAAGSLAVLLRLEGHEVLTAVDGLQAVEHAQRFRPDVVFMDIGMPLVDGAEAARRIRAQAWGHQMHIVALTGWGLEGERSRTAAAGMDDHLLKPPDPRELAAILRRASDPRS
jgi:signal transduction histidine kinase/ActR/RegA family two-component response regulator